MTGVLLVLCFAVLLVWVKFRQSRRATDDQELEQAATSPTVSITVSHAVTSPAERQSPDCGSPKMISRDCWILNPRSPFPLTIVGVDETTIRALRSVLDRIYSDGSWEIHNEFTGIVARSNLRCRELDTYCSEYRPKFEAAITARQEAHPEWAAASELDRADLMAQFEPQALASLDLLPCSSAVVDAEVVLSLFRDEIDDPRADDALIDRYGFELASFYLRVAGDMIKVHKIPADSWQRKKFEALAGAGLARRGAEIPLENLLRSLRLKDLNGLVTDASLKKFTRKAPAIEYLAVHPSTRRELSTRMSFRELFQSLPLPEKFSDLNLQAIAQHWRRSDAVAKVIATTFVGGLAAMDEEEINRILSSDITGWEVFVNEDASPYCKRVSAQAAKSSRMPRLPAHIGCSCRAFPQMR